MVSVGNGIDDDKAQPFKELVFDRTSERVLPVLFDSVIAQLMSGIVRREGSGAALDDLYSNLSSDAIRGGVRVALDADILAHGMPQDPEQPIKASTIIASRIIRKLVEPRQIDSWPTSTI